MKKKYSLFFFLTFFSLINFHVSADNPFYFIDNEEDLPEYNKKNTVMVASSGRSGSTLLAAALRSSTEIKRILKSHLLPESFKNFKGKIIFIFSNPHQATESLFKIAMQKENFGRKHFENVKSSDLSWLNQLGSTCKQTLENNLLIYDALGIYSHLHEWLEELPSADSSYANVLAVKYETLWEPETIRAISKFTSIQKFHLPEKINRGQREVADPLILEIIKYYNRGTTENPYYDAYQPAAAIWEKKPAFMFFKI